MSNALKNASLFLIRLPSLSIVAMIWVYQKTISLDHGLLSKLYGRPLCRFHPTCSEYGAEAFRRFGVVKGFYLAAKRLSRCHPWSDGGIDPLP